MNCRQRWSLAGLALLVLSGLAACASAPTVVEDKPSTTVLLVRHAEKRTDDPRDPSLSATGLERAKRLAALLAHEPLQAVYATDYRRTRETATPTARAHGLAVVTYDANEPAGSFAAQLLARHAGQTVLVVGHSNTVPAIASALAKAQIPEMHEDQFDLVYRVTLPAQGDPVLAVTSY